MVPNFLIWVRGSSLAPPVITQTSTNFLPTSMPAHRSITASITAPPCGQAAGGDQGILFYGLRRGTSQVYVSRRRVRLSFGVKPPISPRPVCLCAREFSPALPPPVKTDLLILRCGRSAAIRDYHA